MPERAHPLELLLRKIEQNASLDDGDRQAILDLPHNVRTLEPGSYTVRDGEPPAHCTVLLSGFAFRQKLSGDGLRQIVAINIPGDAMDFQNLFLGVADHNVQMLTRGDVAFIPRGPLEKLVEERPKIARAILVMTLIDASIFREWVLNVGRRNARTRIAHLLCEFAVRLDDQGLADHYGFELPMTQEQLADATGLTPVHVNRTLKTLQAEGLITRTRRQISFPDWTRLREMADFNHRYLHLDQPTPGKSA
jgi:CRP-like cAMP-binding protein